jgi:hypothetical protein
MSGDARFRDALTSWKAILLVHLSADYWSRNCTVTIKCIATGLPSSIAG